MNTYDPTTPVKVKHQRLLALANFLDDLPSDRFHMPAWVSLDATEHSCGTAGCACGWAATLFQKEGFILRSESYRGTLIFYPALNDGKEKVQVPERIFAEFFGITREFAYAITSAFQGDVYGYLDNQFIMQSYYNFYGTKPDGSDITPRHAADRIRKVLAIVDPDVLKEEEQCKLMSLELKKNLALL